MPKKYHIDVANTPNRFPLVGRSGIVDWGEGCLKCAVCVKSECVYEAYRKRTFSSEIMADTIDQICKDCFRCVQGCPKRLIHKTLNPEWEALGDDAYTPEIISSTWQQAESGKIPVSGAGYGGAYSGPGFDSMWTDMSEIVRPTRDGIHGREYISTVVDIGRRHARLRFDAEGKLESPALPSVRLPLPIIFDLLPFGDLSPAVWQALALAASHIGTRMIVPEQEALMLADHRDVLVPFLPAATTSVAWASGFPIVELEDCAEVFDKSAALKKASPHLIVSIRVAARSANVPRAMELAEKGAEVIHLVADRRGYEPDVAGGVHLKDVIRSFHAALVDGGLRDEVTFMAGGGIAVAEHVIKAMLCGANLVTVEVPLLIALECRVCRRCVEGGGDCPVQISRIAPEWGAARMVNLMGAWHNQLLEMMGAMGIREARRLRGEQGRVMFFEDLEADTFGKLFGQADA